MRDRVSSSNLSLSYRILDSRFWYGRSTSRRSLVNTLGVFLWIGETWSRRKTYFTLLLSWIRFINSNLNLLNLYILWIISGTMFESSYIEIHNKELIYCRILWFDFIIFILIFVLNGVSEHILSGNFFIIFSLSYVSCRHEKIMTFLLGLMTGSLDPIVTLGDVSKTFWLRNWGGSLKD